jgi:hypothetical protein
MRANWAGRGALVLALASAGLSQTPWTWQGPGTLNELAPVSAPYASPMAALALPPNSAPAGTLLAGGMGGVWRLTAGTWQALSPGEPVSALALSSDGSTIYAGTGDTFDVPTRAGSGVLISGDGGQSWTRRGAATFSGMAIAALAVDPSQPGHLLVAAASTTDSPAGVQSGIYASSDGGATWSLVLAGDFTALAWQSGQGSGVLAAGAAGVELSQDGGDTFQPVAASLPASILRAAACPASGGFALLLDAASGASLWQIDTAGAGVALPLPSDFDGTSLALAATGAGLDIGGGNGVWSSDNAGQSWTAITAIGTLTVAGEHALLPAGTVLWLANTNGVWQKHAGSWQEETQGLANAAPVAFALIGADAVASLDGSGLVAGPLGPSSSWAAMPAAPAFASLAAAPQGATLYGLSPAGTLWESRDGGSTWASFSAPAGLTGMPSAMAASSEGLWLGSTTGQLLGPSGQVASLPEAVTALAAGAALWAAAGSRLFTSSDDGASWTKAALAPGSIFSLAADPSQPGRIAVATATGVFLSFDGGGSWENLSSGLPAAPITSLTLDASQTLWASTLGRGVWSLALASTAPSVALSPIAASPPVGSPLALQAQVTAFGAPVVGASVTFAASVHGQAGWTTVALTNASGVASASFTPTQAQPTVILASAEGSSATQSFTPQPLAPASLSVSGQNQSAPAGQTLAIRVIVIDAYGDPVPNVAVSFAAPVGTFNPAQATTDTSGAAATVYTLPAAAGAVTLSATSGAAAAQWSEVALPAPDFALVLTPPATPAAPNQIAQLSLQVSAIGGYAAPVPLSCDSPPGACSISPSSVLPGQSAVVSVNVGAWDDNQSSVAVEVSSQGTHAVSAMLPLQAFTLAASAQSVTLGGSAGTAPLTLTLTPVNGMSGAVALSATLSDGSPLPASLAADFQPANPQLANGAPATAQLVLAAAAAGSQSAPFSWPRDWRGGVLAAAVWMLGVAVSRSRRRAFAIAALAAALAGCGGSASPPVNTAPLPPTSYSLAVTANASGLSASIPLSVIVNSP